MRDPFFRYFLAFRPAQSVLQRLAAAAETAGQRPLVELLHLTLCVIVESLERDPFQAARVAAALAGHALSSIPVRFGRVRCGPEGAMVRTIGRQPDLPQFYRTLLALLEGRGIQPLHRKSGLHPHVTLGYARCQFDAFDIAVEWLPQELLLIESEVGNSRHRVIGRWPLLPPAQGSLPFEMPGQSWGSPVDQPATLLNR